MGTARSTIQLCGDMVVSLRGRRVEGLLPGRQGRTLFAYFVLNRNRDTPADELLTALWPGGGPDRAEATLRTLISKIRGAVGMDVLGRGGRYHLSLPADVRVDLEVARDAIHRAESAVAAEDWHRAWAPAQVTLMSARRGFLPGEEATWIDEVRRELRELETRGLEAYAAASLGIGGTELAVAEQSARRLVEREPYHESGYRILMQALAAEGNMADALLAYERLAGLLREELGADPSPRTRELHRSLLDRT
jgi:DNA-binding SARP family transcriptional activator